MILGYSWLLHVFTVVAVMYVELYKQHWDTSYWGLYVFDCRLEQVMVELESIKDQVLQESGEQEENAPPVEVPALIR